MEKDGKVNAVGDMRVFLVQRSREMLNHTMHFPRIAAQGIYLRRCLLVQSGVLYSIQAMQAVISRRSAYLRCRAPEEEQVLPEPF